MRLRVKYGCGKWIMWGYGGRVLYPFILFAEKNPPYWLYRHEMQHVIQIWRDGYWTFHIKYIYYLIKDGYHDNPYEVEAREIAGG
jgi:hypothetical protein